MNPSTSKAVQDLSWFLTATQQGVVRRFQSLAGSVTLKGPEGYGPIVLIPGQRKNRVLLVAHYDTVWDESFTKTPVRVKFNNGVFYSAIPKVGIGADDRAGCAMLWLLRSLGHTLLLVPGEEKGCIGSRFMLKEHPSLLAGHTMALEFDRRGSDDIATYDCYNEAHVSYLQRFFPDYTKTHGSSTDVRILGPGLGIAIANLSVGFYAEHTQAERLRLGDFCHCYWGTHDLLQVEDIPSFKFQAWSNPYTSIGGTSNSASFLFPGNNPPKALVASQTLPVSPRVHPSTGDHRNEGAAALRSLAQTPPKQIITVTRPVQATFILGDHDERVAVTAETGEVYCPDCHQFITPGAASWNAAMELTCPFCATQLHSFFS